MTCKTTTPDMINSPPHYIGAGGIEAIDVLEYYDLGLHLGTAMAYLLRAGRKGPKAEDLRKARWWFQRWVDADLKEPTALAVALDWADPVNIVNAFGLAGFHADATEAILDMAVFSNPEPPMAILTMFDEAIVEAEGQEATPTGASAAPDAAQSNAGLPRVGEDAREAN